MPAPVHRPDLTGDERAGLAGQVRDEIGDLSRPSGMRSTMAARRSGVQWLVPSRTHRLPSPTGSSSDGAANIGLTPFTVTFADAVSSVSSFTSATTPAFAIE